MKFHFLLAAVVCYFLIACGHVEKGDKTSPESLEATASTSVLQSQTPTPTPVATINPAVLTTGKSYETGSIDGLTACFSDDFDSAKQAVETYNCTVYCKGAPRNIADYNRQGCYEYVPNRYGAKQWFMNVMEDSILTNPGYEPIIDLNVSQQWYLNGDPFSK